ncbi:unnamed protein product [Rhizopus stolonifer]
MMNCSYVPLGLRNRSIFDDNDISQKFFNLQVKVAECVNDNSKDVLVLEECRPLQNIPSLKPYQNNQVMLDMFGAETLNAMYKSRMDVWTNGCPSLSTE